MRESIGNSMVFTIMLIFIGAMIAILVSSVAYSKASKVKNMIADKVEKYAEKADNGLLSTSSFADGSALAEEINTSLKTIGYRINSTYVNNCPTTDGVLLNGNSSYKYCVYLHQSSRGPYYKVVAYMYFDFPIIGDFIEFPVSTETKIIYDLGNK